MNFRKSKRLNVASLNFLNMYFVKLSFQSIQRGKLIFSNAPQIIHRRLRATPLTNISLANLQPSIPCRMRLLPGKLPRNLSATICFNISPPSNPHFHSLSPYLFSMKRAFNFNAPLARIIISYFYVLG